MGGQTMKVTMPPMSSRSPIIAFLPLGTVGVIF
jgi:hypothetical protein